VAGSLHTFRAWLPQRGSTELERWKNEAVVERFTGHSDVVKEFVWRRGLGECGSTGSCDTNSRVMSTGGNTFQLITRRQIEVYASGQSIKRLWRCSIRPRLLHRADRVSS
jgi:hypothetical protein